MAPQSRVKVKEREWIKPARPTPDHVKHVPLSDWDVVMFKSYTPLLVFYTNPDNMPRFMDTDSLKESLSQVLCHYYPLAGRLADIGQGRDEIVCNDAGVLFQEAEYEDELKPYRKQGYLPSQVDYHNLFPVHFYASEQDPLVAIQVTRFLDGGVALGVMILHKIADVYSMCLFLDAWGKSARGVDYARGSFRRDLVAVPPDTVITDEVIAHYREEHTVTPFEDSPDTMMRQYHRQPMCGSSSSVKPLKSVILEFYSDGLQRCKKDAHTKEMIRDKNWLSTKDALFAMLLRAIVRSRDIGEDVPVKIAVGVNGRPKMKNAKKMECYFGNWMVSQSIVTTRQEIKETTLVYTAVSFRQRMAGLRASLFHGLSKLYTTHSDMTVHYLAYQPNSSIHFTASDVSSLPLWRLDFGYGRPDRARGYITSGGNGCMVIFGQSDNTKGHMYDVQLQMDAGSIRRFIDDPEVKKYTRRVHF